MRFANCLNEVRPRRPEQCADIRRQLAEADVSMKSGLEGRNNPPLKHSEKDIKIVSMKSGLEGRNNKTNWHSRTTASTGRLNEVRPRRPEQSGVRLVLVDDVEGSQ